jgi:hypothetical protein
VFVVSHFCHEGNPGLLRRDDLAGALFVPGFSHLRTAIAKTIIASRAAAAMAAAAVQPNSTAARTPKNERTQPRG